MKVRFLRAARNEFREAIRYYNGQRIGLGSEFREEVRAAVQRIEEYPLA